MYMRDKHCGKLEKTTDMEPATALVQVRGEVVQLWFRKFSHIPVCSALNVHEGPQVSCLSDSMQYDLEDSL